MDPSFLITAWVALFVIIDPIGMTPLFVALTQGETARRRRAIALRLRDAAEAVGGGGGGHDVAAGATIPTGREIAFVERVDELVADQLQ